MSAASAKIRAALERHKHLLDLDRDSLGRDLCKAATDGVQACLAGEHAPDGTRWDDLSERYEEWKSFAYPGHGISLLHGAMDDPREVAGELDPPTRRRAVVTYGVSEQARCEAEWFQAPPEGSNQPPRPFWGFTAASLNEIEKILTDRLRTA